MVVVGGTLKECEKWWRDHYHWFEDRRYTMGSRYHPDWTPLWTTASEYFYAEDAQTFFHPTVIAATHSNGTKVVMKRLYGSSDPFEAYIARTFGSGRLAEDPRNHCVPILDVFYVDEDNAVIVMPLLRPFYTPRWDTVGEVVECWRQIFEGVYFMHLMRTAHRDCTKNNIMLDGSSMYPDSFNPVVFKKLPDLTGRAPYLTRTQRPPRYYLTDFGLSVSFDPNGSEPLAYPVCGGDKTAPECQTPDVRTDPFPTDVYYLGNWVLWHFLENMHGLEFMRPLALEMTALDPKARPTMADVVARLDTLIKALGSWKLRSRPTPRDEFLPVTCFRTVQHSTRRLFFALNGTPSIPRPRSDVSSAGKANRLACLPKTAS